jgi:hypothetical protein
LLEDLDVKCRVYGDNWYEELRNALQLKNDKEADKVHWITDENLRAFFKAEGDKDELKRLTTAAGKGMY